MQNNEQKNIMVSVLSLSYNHQKYIAECIEGVLLQKTNFQIEMIIPEDCSTDDTRKIIQDYQNKFPDIIKPIYRQKNMGYFPNFIDAYKTCKGKCIAICEGDDYWISPDKLQLQVDFLEKNQDYVISFHNAYVKNEINNTPIQIYEHSNAETTTQEELAQGRTFFSVSALFRNNIIKDFPLWYSQMPTNDYPLYLLLTQYGKINYIHKAMAVYRVNNQGLWSGENNLIVRINWLKALNVLINNHEGQIQKNLIHQQNLLLNNLLDVIKDFNTEHKNLKNLNTQYSNSYSYRLGNLLLKPFSFFKKLIK